MLLVNFLSPEITGAKILNLNKGTEKGGGSIYLHVDHVDNNNLDITLNRIGIFNWTFSEGK